MAETRDSFDVPIPFIELLGIEMVRFGDGVAELRFPLRPEHCNSFQVAHGGAVMTLLDVTMAHAARSVDREVGCVTIEMKTSFMRPAQGVLTARGKLVHRTRSMAFVEATLHDEKGQLCAQATGTFKYVRRTAPTAAAPNVISTD